VTCAETAPALGAYVLGALEPEDRRRFEEHLARCRACAAELAEFRLLPGLLDHVDPDDLQPVRATPSPELFARLSAVASTEQQHRPPARRWALVAAAVLVVLGIGIGAGFAVRGGPSGPETRTATAGPVEITLVTSAADGGSALDITVAGMRPGETCRLVAVDRDGGTHPAGEWPTSADGDGRWRGWADVDPADLAQVIVLGDGGREVVRVPL
jgi:anti-sigma factor RsiW